MGRTKGVPSPRHRQLLPTSARRRDRGGEGPMVGGVGGQGEAPQPQQGREGEFLGRRAISSSSSLLSLSFSSSSQLSLLVRDILLDRSDDGDDDEEAMEEDGTGCDEEEGNRTSARSSTRTAWVADRAPLNAGSRPPRRLKKKKNPTKKGTTTDRSENIRKTVRFARDGASGGGVKEEKYEGGGSTGLDDSALFMRSRRRRRLRNGAGDEIIPSRPELYVDVGTAEERGEEGEEGGAGVAATVIEYNGWAPTEKWAEGARSMQGAERDDGDAGWLRSIPLPSTAVEISLPVRDPDDDRCCGPTNVRLPDKLPIRSPGSLRTLFAHYGTRALLSSRTPGSGEEDGSGGSPDRCFVGALQGCLEAGFVAVWLQRLEAAGPTGTGTDGSGVAAEPDAWFLQVCLTRRALEACHPDVLPAGRRRRPENRQGPARLEGWSLVHAVLRALVPGLDAEAPPVPSSSRRGGGGPNGGDSGSKWIGPITAKRVYKLVDNRQLERALAAKAAATPPPMQTQQPQLQQHHSTDGSLTGPIPGLIPTLRGYQQCAVEWMLRREKQTATSSEWELAWMVAVAPEAKTGLEKGVRAIGSASSLGLEFRLLPHVHDPAVRSGGGTPAEPMLFFCPYFGWLASSYDSARSMTLGSGAETEGDHGTTLEASQLSSVKGGILSESMGLGKSVEVLACILANPRPKEQWSVPSRVGARRRLTFDDDREAPFGNASHQDGVPVGIGVIKDMSEFGDAESSSDDDGPDSSVRFAGHPRTTMTTPTPVPVTPEGEPVDEVWVEKDVIGSCICGMLIGFSHRKSLGGVVLCESCDEPMHKECAGFLCREDIQSCTKPLRYRQKYSNRSLEFAVCDKTRCPCCIAADGEKLPSRATLIITPPAILNQWEREITRHSRSPSGEPLKTVVYMGLEPSCKATSSVKAAAMKLLHPRHLSDADIVLTTFDALMGDLAHSDENRFIASKRGGNDNYLRKRKRYRAVPTPLLSINWWRVCLDEAQRVETPTASSARMALKLSAENRWCVSGTPIGRGKLEDLFGLLLFLRLNPFSSKVWFNKCFIPSSGMVDDQISHLLSQLLWRSTTSHPIVRKEMGVPEQVEKKIVLRASSIEKHFYERLLEKTLATAGDMSEREHSGKKRKNSQLDVLSEHLHQLRAACCHPQVGSGGISTSKRARATNDSSASTIGSRVMTMDQILDKFIDDAKLRCEEAQRLTVMHMNAMAAIWTLRIEAKERGVKVKESDGCLLANSCRLYLQSLSLTDTNATPTLAVGDAILSGSNGFSSTRRTFRRGSSTAVWSMQRGVKEAWVIIEFEGAARKITEFRLRPVTQAPQESSGQEPIGPQCSRLRPKKCVLQVASTALGGAFVDVTSFLLPDICNGTKDIPWVSEGGFRTNKAKCWRIVIKSFYSEGTSPWGGDSTSPMSVAFTGLDFELYEADIASDPLQRLHSIHNAVLTFESVLGQDGSTGDSQSNLNMSREDMETKVILLNKEATRIENLYMEVARSTHEACMIRLRESSSHRKAKLQELLSLSRRSGKKLAADSDGWEDEWWDDFLSHLMVNGKTFQADICEKLLQDLDGVLSSRVEVDSFDRDKVKFPEFSSVSQFRAALLLRVKSIRSGLGKDRLRASRAAAAAAVDVPDSSDPFIQVRSSRFRCAKGQHNACMEAISNLSSRPSTSEVFENAHCHVCKADWFQTGPTCSHCRLHESLRDLAPDHVTLTVLTSLHGMVRSSLGISLLSNTDLESRACISERAKLFFEVLEAEKREKALAYRAWRVHLDLLNDHDELNQCKSAMRLTYEGEDVTQLTSDQLNAVVVPLDLAARFHSHASRQAMAHGELRRAKDTLRYLRNLSRESDSESSESSGGGESCALCLSPFERDQFLAVLNCGHRFHNEPCIQQLQARRSGTFVRCPMRCPQSTPANNVMIACSNVSKSTEGVGNGARRPVKGSWGTKVTRLVADVIEMRDGGEKGVIFSQWEDMLNIVQQALKENGIEVVRPSGAKRIGEAVNRFRSSSCMALLLNVKNGGEGLTLIEATHVFMVEPLLDCGLDSQAVNRIVRIGQTKKTHVWRYLVEDTIEMKIDAIRVEQIQNGSDDDSLLEDETMMTRKYTFKAGGIDGGFQTQEELLELLR